MAFAAEEHEQTVLPQENGEELVITVEGNEEAEGLGDSARENGMAEVVDQDIPLAAGPQDGPADIHIIWPLLFFLGAVLYAVYFRYEQRRIFALKREAAIAEHEAGISAGYEAGAGGTGGRSGQ